MWERGDGGGKQKTKRKIGEQGGKRKKEPPSVRKGPEKRKDKIECWEGAGEGAEPEKTRQGKTELRLTNEPLCMPSPSGWDRIIAPEGATR